MTLNDFEWTDALIVVIRDNLRRFTEGDKLLTFIFGRLCIMVIL